MKKSIRNFYAVLFFLIIVQIMSICFRQNWTYAKQHKNILVINSYNISYPTATKQIEGIKSVFDGKDINIDVEFLDSKRFNTKENMDNFYTSLKYKIDTLEKYDVIIACDDNALLFAKAQQEDLFKGVPIVFLGVNDVDLAVESCKSDMVTGIVEAVSIRETIDTALSLNRNVDKLYVISDSTSSGKGSLKSFYNATDDLKGVAIEEINLENYTFDQLASRLTNIENDSAILLLSALVDKNGESLNFYQSLELIVRSSKEPIFHLWEHGIGQGILGGKVIDHHQQGRQAALISEQILNGADVSDIELITHSPNTYIFDNKIMQHYGIQKKDLPSNSFIINEEFHFFKKYQKVLHIGIVILIGLAIIIIVLILNILGRRKIEKELILKNDELLSSKKEIQESKIKLKEQYDSLLRYAYYDELTGLPNRRKLNEIIANVIEYSKMNNKGFAILFIGLDKFKIINDTYGHTVGDKIIKTVGNRLQELDIDDRFISRLGGDEFIMLLMESSDKKNINAEVEKIFDCFKDSIKIMDNDFYVSSSVGISVYPEDGTTIKDLLKNADAAMYKAKIGGKNHCEFYEKTINKELNRRLIIQNSLHDALKNNEFKLYFQPQFDIKLKKIIGYEALIRWFNSQLGFVSPDEFIPIAEETGVISDIGRWVIENSCTFASKVNEMQESRIVISINTSVIELIKDDFVSNLREIMKNNDVDPKMISIEITESALIDNYDLIEKKFKQIKEMGLKISLDDFGTGYSSLQYLKKLNIDTLKIDKAFIDDMLIDNDKEITKAIILIAHSLNMDVVAEGVETKEQMLKLNEYKCDVMQGYLISKPVEEKEAMALLDNIKL